MTTHIYLDNQTTTKPSAKSVSKMMPFLTERFGNASSPHKMGQELNAAKLNAYEQIYQLLQANQEGDFVLTSSGAEAVNHVIFSTYHDVTRSTGKNHFLTSTIDEAATLLSINRLEQMGSVAKLIPVDNQGRITPENVAEAITPRTAIISLSLVNGLTGVIHPMKEVAALCKERGIPLHLDMTHALGKLDLSLEKIDADYLTFNGDNLHAVKGTGGLYIKQGKKLSPFILGGYEQAGNRAGPLNMASLASLGEASSEMIDNRDYLCTEIARLRDKLEKEIQKNIPGSLPLFQETERVPTTTAILFPGIVNEALLFLLNKKGVYASMGGGSFQQIGHMLTASHLSPQDANSTLSFCLSRYTTEEEIDRAIVLIVESFEKLKKLSAKL